MNARTLTGEDGRRSIVVYSDGDILIADESHPNFSAIASEVADAILDGREPDNLADLFDVAKAVARKFESVTERVSLHGGTVYFDNEPVHNALTETILRFHERGEDFTPLVNFFEKVEQNPNAHSREQLYTWIDRHGLTITKAGDILAYKGVVKTDGEDGTVYTSVSKGRAIVDGQEHSGAIPNHVGAVVEMPRSEVQHDPTVGCHTGLHAGTWSYASGFARGATLTVIINPRDVVSVPTDCDAQKMRVCRYTVDDVTEQEYTEPLYIDYDDEYDDLGYGDEDDDVTYEVGDYVEVVANFEDGDLFDWLVGERGTVEEVDPDNEYVVIRLDNNGYMVEAHPGELELR